MEELTTDELMCIRTSVRVTISLNHAPEPFMTMLKRSLVKIELQLSKRPDLNEREKLHYNYIQSNENFRVN